MVKTKVGWKNPEIREIYDDVVSDYRNGRKVEMDVVVKLKFGYPAFPSEEELEYAARRTGGVECERVFTDGDKRKIDAGKVLDESGGAEAIYKVVLKGVTYFEEIRDVLWNISKYLKDKKGGVLPLTEAVIDELHVHYKDCGLKFSVLDGEVVLAPSELNYVCGGKNDIVYPSKCPYRSKEFCKKFAREEPED